MSASASPRILRTAGYLAVLYGGLGVFAGLSGAATFIPYRSQDGLTSELAVALTLVSAVGAIFSFAGVISSWGLIRARSWAARTALGAALGCVATVAAMAAIMPVSSPSPAPGGVGAFGFLAVVAGAYGLELLLLLVRRGPAGGRTAGPAAN